MSVIKPITTRKHPDATLFHLIAKVREAWMNCEMAWNAGNLDSDFGASDSHSDALVPVSENLLAAEGCLRQMLGCKPYTVRGAWAYLELMRDMTNHLRLNPESSISDIDYAPHLANIATCLECHVYSDDEARADLVAG
jgi:hypothetical protein